MRNPILLIIAATITGLIGFLGVHHMAAGTTFAAQASTLGGIFSVSIFFGLTYVLGTMSSGYEVRNKMRNMRKTRKITVDQNQDKAAKLAAATKFAQKALMLGDTHLPEMRDKLLRAGYFTDEALFFFVLLRCTILVLGLVLGILLFLAGVSPTTAMVSGFIISVLGWFLPLVFISFKAKARRQALFEQFPDAIDLIIVYVESGNSFDNAVTRVVETLRKRYPAVSSELRLLEYELRYFTNRNIALENMERRCNLDLVTRLVSIIQQSEQIGSPIAESLKILAQDTREERFLNAERKVEKLPVILQVPLVLFILPSLFLLVLGPIGLQIVNVFGHLAK